MSLESAKPASALRRRPSLAIWMIGATLIACIAAIIFRTEIRSRYWAWRVAHAPLPEQLENVQLLISAGDDARWGVSALCADGDPHARQYGALILGSLKSGWARQRLLELLHDFKPEVRELAAQGLSRIGGTAVVSELSTLARAGDVERQRLALLALSRIPSQSAFEALRDAAATAETPAARTALIDALDVVRSTDCVPLLLKMLSDDRACPQPSRAEQAAARLLGQLRSDNLAPTTGMAASTAGDTIAERAARVLVRITGVDPPFSSPMPPDERGRAVRQWADWHAARTEGP